MADLAQETIDYVAITRLHAAYADTVTRRAWPELAQQFLPDAPVRVDTVTNPAVDLAGATQIGEFIAGAIERFELFEFVILNTHVELYPGGDRDRASARLYMCELRQDAATGHFTQAFGLYRDRLQRVEGRWWFARRDYQSLARTGRNPVFPFPEA